MKWHPSLQLKTIFQCCPKLPSDDKVRLNVAGHDVAITKINAINEKNDEIVLTGQHQVNVIAIGVFLLESGLQVSAGRAEMPSRVLFTKSLTICSTKRIWSSTSFAFSASFPMSLTPTTTSSRKTIVGLPLLWQGRSARRQGQMSHFSSWCVCFRLACQ